MHLSNFLRAPRCFEHVLFQIQLHTAGGVNNYVQPGTLVHRILCNLCKISYNRYATSCNLEQPLKPPVTYVTHVQIYKFDFASSMFSNFYTHLPEIQPIPLTRKDSCVAFIFLLLETEIGLKLGVISAHPRFHFSCISRSIEKISDHLEPAHSAKSENTYLDMN